MTPFEQSKCPVCNQQIENYHYKVKKASDNLSAGNMKVITDVSLVVAAVLLSFIFLADLYGVREGTIAAAICVGLVSKMVIRLIGPYQRWLTS